MLILGKKGKRRESDASNAQYYRKSLNRDSGANRLMLPEMSDWGRDRDALDLNRLLLHGRDIVAKANRVMRD